MALGASNKARVCRRTNSWAHPGFWAPPGGGYLRDNGVPSMAPSLRCRRWIIPGVQAGACRQPESVEMIGTDSVRVLVLARKDRDGLASIGACRNAGLRAELCTSPIELVLGLKAGAGAALIAEEALSGQLLDDLAIWIGRQPPWSDLPFVVLTSRQEQPAIAAWRQCLIVRLRNVVLLERPVQPVTLVSSALSSVRARRCQYEVRAHLAERRQAALALNTLAAARAREIEAADIALRSEIARRECVEALLHQPQRVKAVS